MAVLGPSGPFFLRQLPGFFARALRDQWRFTGTERDPQTEPQALRKSFGGS